MSRRSTGCVRGQVEAFAHDLGAVSARSTSAGLMTLAVFSDDAPPVRRALPGCGIVQRGP